LLFEVYKPKERLKPADIYRSKPEIAAGMIRELKAMGFRFKLVLADSLYGESGCGFINVLYELKLDFVVAIRQSIIWLPREQTVRCNRWRKFKRVFSDGKTELREKLFLASAALNNIGNWPPTQRRCQRMQRCVMTHIEKLKYDQVGNLYGLRNWVEYGLKQSKNELGWADFRVTNYAQIERWWEMVMSAYLLVSLHTNALHQPQPQPPIQRDAQPQAIVLKLTISGLESGKRVKQVLNNLRLVIQPSVILNLLQPWLNLFPIPRLSAGLECLVALMNRFPSRLPCHAPQADFHFSSA